MKKENQIERANRLKENFLSFVPKLPKKKCWIWQGSINGNGYGRLYDNYNHIAAHRLAIILHTQSFISKKQFVCHKCNTPLCVNPNHLYIGTQSENMLQAQKEGRTAGFLNPQKKVRQLSLEGIPIRDFDSVSDIVRELKFNQGNISSVCRGERNHANGFKWVYFKK